LTTAVEHSANIKFGRHLIQQGCEVTFLPVESDGSLDLHLLEQSIRPDTAIVSVMYANNETGVIFPIEEIAAICRYKEVPFHTDAVQTPGKLKLDVKALGVDFLSLSGHKLHAPKGIGLLYVRSGARLQPYLIGGGQERGRRGGTENVPYILGFGRAARLAGDSIAEENIRVRALRDPADGEGPMPAIDKLIAGFRSFRERRFPELRPTYEALVDRGQRPGVALISCADSRLDPALVLQAEPGELFVVRNVANLVPPYEREGRYHGTSAALDYAVRQLEVGHIVVLGHARCGGIRSLFQPADPAAPESEFVAPWMNLVRSAYLRVEATMPEAPQEEKERRM